MLVPLVCTKVPGATDATLRGTARSKKVSIMLGNALSDALRGNHFKNFAPPAAGGSTPPDPPFVLIN